MAVPEAMERLGTSLKGLSSREAARRLAAHGPNRLEGSGATSAAGLFLAQFGGAIPLLLLGSAALSWFLGASTDAAVIFAILLVSGGLSFWQHHNADRAMSRLLSLVEIRATVLRDGEWREIPVAEVVPGDIVSLCAGDIVPGDCLLLEHKDLFTNEAALTGESYPVAKQPGVVPAAAPVAARTNMLFMGTHVVSGTGRALVAGTGAATEFGRLAEGLRRPAPETEFERGSRRFGYFLLEVTLLLVLAVFAVNVYLDRPALTALMFSLALAVGLTPQLLPAVISVNLAQGARAMAKKKVIVKKPNAIENFGAMDFLCSDKTGTLTEGTVRLHSAIGIDGRPSGITAQLAFLNAAFQTGFRNPIDEALTAQPFTADGWRKIDEIPYDFIRKRLSVLAEGPAGRLMITKGAFENVLAVCDRAEADGRIVPLQEVEADLRRLYTACGENGLRVLALARREIPPERTTIVREDEAAMIFTGLLLFHDPVKGDAARAVAELARMGIGFKLITGDNRVVARRIWREIGLAEPAVITGRDLAEIGAEALPARAAAVDVFAEMEPHQKERVILALRKAGHVVGYLGDGINDGPALYAADIGISVQGAVDVAREAADIVLLDKDLGVLAEGVAGGRRTFANTMKYVFMATSANFGNMFSMAGASLFLPFLPLLPKQVLLTNLLTDLPEMTIAADDVDPELVARPRRWDVGFIRRFMITFGLLSSVFDYLTFAVLLFVLRAPTELFRTGWLQESVISAALIVLVVRSRRPFWRSRPSTPLTLMTLAVTAATIALPHTPLGAVFGLTPLPPGFLAVLALIIVLYVGAAEAAKKAFYRPKTPGNGQGNVPAFGQAGQTNVPTKVQPRHNPRLRWLP